MDKNIIVRKEDGSIEIQKQFFNPENLKNIVRVKGRIIKDPISNDIVRDNDNYALFEIIE